MLYSLSSSPCQQARLGSRAVQLSVLRRVPRRRTQAVPVACSGSADPYEVLGVPRGSRMQDIKAARSILMKEVQAGVNEWAEYAAAVNAAYKHAMAECKAAGPGAEGHRSGASAGFSTGETQRVFMDVEGFGSYLYCERPRPVFQHANICVKPRTQDPFDFAACDRALAQFDAESEPKPTFRSLIEVVASWLAALKLSSVLFAWAGSVTGMTALSNAHWIWKTLVSFVLLDLVFFYIRPLAYIAFEGLTWLTGWTLALAACCWIGLSLWQGLATHVLPRAAALWTHTLAFPPVLWAAAALAMAGIGWMAWQTYGGSGGARSRPGGGWSAA